MITASSISSEQSYLSRALGFNPEIEIDYQAVPVDKGDTFLLATDGAYEYASARFMAEAIHGSATIWTGLPASIVAEAYRRGSQDNLTVQIVRIDELPDSEADEIFGQRVANFRFLRCWMRGWCSTDIGSSANCMPAAEATSIWRPTSRAMQLVVLENSVDRLA